MEEKEDRWFNFNYKVNYGIVVGVLCIFSFNIYEFKLVIVVFMFGFFCFL